MISISRIQFLKLVVFTLIIISFLNLGLLIGNFDDSAQQFKSQALSLMNGRLDIDFFDPQDVVVFEGRNYWHQGIVPAILLLPLLYIDQTFFSQGHVQILLVLLIFVLIFNLSRGREFKLTILESAFVALIFINSTFLLKLLVTPSSWFYAQITALFLGMAIVTEFFAKRRYLILGVLGGLLFLTRPTALIVLLLPITALALEIKNQNAFLRNKFLGKVVYFLTPLMLVFLVNLYLNYLKFGSPFFNAYAVNNVVEFSSELRSVGVHHVQHIIMNFYWYFLASLEPIVSQNGKFVYPYYTYNTAGLSLIICAPILAWCFRAPVKNNVYALISWMGIAVLLVFLLPYFGTGWQTFGPRYMADAIPFFVILLLLYIKSKNYSYFFLTTGLISAILNTYLVWTHPFF